MKKSLLRMKKTAFLVFFMAGLMFVSSFLSVFVFPKATAKVSDGMGPTASVGKNVDGLITEIDDPAFSTAQYVDPDKIYSKTSAFIGSDDVTVMIVADDRSLIKKYNEVAYKDYEDVASYIDSLQGRTYADTLTRKQSELMAQLRSRFDITFNYSFTALFNGFSATVKYADIDEIEEMTNVSRVVISEKYSAPQVSSYELLDAKTGDAVENKVEIYDTGIFDASKSGYNGLGTVVAVIDTGIDYTHSAFDPETFLGNLTNADQQKLPLTLEKVEEIVKNNKLVASNNLLAGTFYPGNTDNLTGKDVYINEKIPFGYDYADHDPDPFPINDHGTHVSGIIAGEDEVITGVAPKAQLLAMKVFPDADDGSESEEILAAVEDCVKIGVDTINMSLGRDSGFAREADDDFTNTVYEGVEAAGISLVCAASNSYSSGFNSNYGSNLLSNPDSGTVGSPSTYHAALSVASISGQKSNYMLANPGVGNAGTAVYFSNPVDNNSEEIKFFDRFFEKFGLGDNETKDIEYVVVPGIGDTPNYIGIDVSGKVALIQRGTSSFEDKIKIAMNKGAAAAIIYNNVAGNISMVVGKDELIPSCSITMDMGKILVDAALANKASGGINGGVLRFSKKNQAGPFISQFSSWGPSPDLELKPEITGHGGDIYSAIIGGGYDHLSGTSMASPNLAGVVTLLRQHVKEHLDKYIPNASSMDNIEVTKQVRAIVNQLLMSTATPALTEVGDPYSPRKQGAGLANLTASINTDAYLYVEGNDKTKLSLGDDPEKKGVYDLTFNIKNLSDTTKNYTLEPIIMTESVSIDLRTVAEKAYMINDSVIDFSVAAEDASEVSFAKQGDKYNITVNGKADATVTVKITLSAEIKSYLEKNFPNGMYVEGFIRLIPDENTMAANDCALNIPYLAFYGDWTKAPIYDLDFKAVYDDKYDDSIPDEDKIKAAVRPITLAGKAVIDNSEYIYFMGEYMYALPDPNTNPSIFYGPTYHDEYVSMSLDPAGIHDFYLIGGFLRNFKRMDVKIVHAETGELMAEDTFWNGSKAGVGSIGGIVMEDAFDVTRYVSENGKRFEEGNKYTFTFTCRLDYDGNNDGELDKATMDTYAFDFVIDSTAPVLQDYQVRVEYNPKETNNPYRYYLDTYIYDNNYPQGYQVQFYDKNSDSYVSPVGRYMIPINAERNSVTRATLEITDYWEKIKEADYTIYVTTGDYAMNDSTYYVKLVDMENNELGLYNDIKDISLAKSVSKLAADGSVELDDKNNPTLKDQLKIYQSYDLFAKYALDVKSRWHEDYEKFVKECAEQGLATLDEKSGQYILNSSVQLSNWLSTERAAWLEDYVFESSDEAFDITSQGVITPTPEAFGKSAVITVSSKHNPSVKTSFNVVCGRQSATDVSKNKINFSYVEMSDNYMELPAGAEYEISCKVLPENATDKYVISWRLSYGDKYASIRLDPDNNFHVFVTGKEEGRAQVTATVQTVDENGNKTNTIYMGSCIVEIPEEFVVNYGTLQEYHGAREVLEIPDDLGIKTIGSGVFFKNNSLREVYIPEGVETIDNAAFAYCNNLRIVHLPSTLKEIKEWAFAGWVDWNDDGVGGSLCSKLTTVTLAKGKDENGREKAPLLRYVGKRAFIYCFQLTELFVDYDSWKADNTAKLPLNLSTVKVIDEYAFFYCAQLGYVGLNSNPSRTLDLSQVKSIGTLAFAYCQLLMDVKFGEKTIIGTNAFTGDYWLGYLTNGEVTIPSTHIGEGAFAECYDSTRSIGYLQTLKLTGEKVMIGKEAFAYNPTLQQIQFTGTIREIGERAFAECTKLGRLTIPNGLEYLRDYAFENCTNLTYLTVNGAFDASVFNGTAFSGCSRLTNIIENNDSYVYESGILYNNAKDTIVLALTNAKLADNKIPDDVKKIEKYAFQNNAHLNELDLNQVETLGVGAFSGCPNLTSVTVPASVTEISDYAFNNCANLATVTYKGSDLDRIGRYAFAGCVKLASIDALNAETIAEGAFSGDTILKTVTNTGNLTTLGARAFELCEALTDLDISKVETIGSYAFDGCVAYAPSVINAQTIGNYAFRGAEKVAVATLANAEYIGDYAFSQTGIKAITLPKATFIGDYAFGINYVYESEDLEESMVNYNSNVTSVEMPVVEYIGEGAFSGAKDMTTVNIPASATYIGKKAFANSGITKFTVDEASESFGAYDLQVVDSEADCDYVVMKDGEAQYIKLIDGDVLYRIVPNGFELISYPTKKSDETFEAIPHTIRIEYGAFINNTSIKNVELPYEMAYIGDYAFFGCSALENFTFHSLRAPLLESGYYIIENVKSEGYSKQNDLPEDDPNYYVNNSSMSFSDKNFASYYTFGAIPDIDLDNLDASKMKFTYPSNGIGYKTYIYARYFAVSKSDVNSKEIVLNDSANDFLNRVASELPEIDSITEENAAVVRDLISIYASIEMTQRNLIDILHKEVGEKINASEAYLKSKGWDKVKYTVTFENADVPSQIIDEGGHVQQPADPTREGYTFDGWYRDASLNTKFNFEMYVRSNLTIYAKWINNNGDGSDDPNQGGETQQSGCGGCGTIGSAGGNFGGYIGGCLALLTFAGVVFLVRRRRSASK